MLWLNWTCFPYTHIFRLAPVIFHLIEGGWVVTFYLRILSWGRDRYTSPQLFCYFTYDLATAMRKFQQFSARRREEADAYFAVCFLKLFTRESAHIVVFKMYFSTWVSHKSSASGTNYLSKCISMRVPKNLWIADSQMFH